MLRGMAPYMRSAAARKCRENARNMDQKHPATATLNMRRDGEIWMRDAGRLDGSTISCGVEEVGYVEDGFNRI